ncbi:DUF1700 domain-containing protein [Lacrimispora saccharolytica]|uniref:DUF1700 domain-containing protein n=1 Tax=Lacrimispora saccharolytica (strain ATCC 35040 / DSM 2544 / NRCC 2533 / WM1) TaxID=610130 RepID=D9R4C2_LACSW|nr:hypothetical protein [Lacrimispora saccharolytica]ADL04992.1 protein of unknown function DUF1700 [[Clostridium] saccharolyticum WM1]QRV20806.1 hypothetical protein I6K70_04650 [Lacrimispora saccharolytica]
MSRDEFMRELEYLLSDIPDEEKADAIGYYRDYLEEAGPENEENVIREFESPERIAAIIRSDISGNLKDGGEFTETGYRDERFRDPNYQMAKRYDLPEVSEERRYQEGERENKHARRRRTMDGNRTVKFILWMILIIAASPMLLGIGGGLAGIAGGLIGILAAAVIGIGAITFALLAAGVCMVLAGIVSMVIHPLSGALLLGLGVLFLGLGLIALAVSGAFYGRFLPFLFRSFVNVLSRLFHGRRSRL